MANLPNLQLVPQQLKVEPILPTNRSELRRLLVLAQNRGWKCPLAEITLAGLTVI